MPCSHELTACAHPPIRFFYYDPAKPKMQGASVTVRRPGTGLLLTITASTLYT